LGPNFSTYSGLGWVGLGQSVDGLGWIGSHKMDPRTTLVGLMVVTNEHTQTDTHTEKPRYICSNRPYLMHCIAMRPSVIIAYNKTSCYSTGRQRPHRCCRLANNPSMSSKSAPSRWGSEPIVASSDSNLRTPPCNTNWHEFLFAGLLVVCRRLSTAYCGLPYRINTKC